VLEQQVINLQHLELESVDCINLAEEIIMTDLFNVKIGRI